jgi:AraC family transcriptional regulator
MDPGDYLRLTVDRLVLTREVSSLQFPPGEGWRLMVVLSGAARLRHHHGTRSAEAPSVRGDVWATPPGQPVRFTCSVLSVEPVQLASTVILADWARQPAGQQAPGTLHHEGPRRDYSESRCDLTVLSALESLLAVQENGADPYYADAVIRHLAAHVNHAMGAPGQAPDGHGTRDDALPPEQLAAVTRYMREHLSQPISLDALAAVTRYSRYHFLRRFTAAIGRTPYKYLTDLRIDVARRWLESPGNHTVAGIARDCGFPSPENFTRAFRKRLGVTPSHYLRGHRPNVGYTPSIPQSFTASGSPPRQDTGSDAEADAGPSLAGP